MEQRKQRMIIFLQSVMLKAISPRDVLFQFDVISKVPKRLKDCGETEQIGITKMKSFSKVTPISKAVGSNMDDRGGDKVDGTAFDGIQNPGCCSQLREEKKNGWKKWNKYCFFFALT
jgi:hypothetical protein